MVSGRREATQAATRATPSSTVLEIARRREVVARYEQQTGRAVPQSLFYFAFGLYKIGVIIQQIYARYRRGLTRDARFAGLIDLERALARMGVDAVARDSI